MLRTGQSFCVWSLRHVVAACATIAGAPVSGNDRFQINTDFGYTNASAACLVDQAPAKNDKLA